VSLMSDWIPAPQPTCRAHDVLISQCLPCCVVFGVDGGHWTAVERESWWVENTYIKEGVS
jgi:hypothetical protein